MQIAVRIGIVAFGLLVVVAAYETAQHATDSPEIATAKFAVNRHLVQQAVDSFPPREDWAGISIDDVQLNSYALTLRYASPPASPAEVETDAKAIVRAMLYHLTLGGHHPSDEQTSITVQAQQTPAGTIGVARYDPVRDAIIFKAR